MPIIRFARESDIPHILQLIRDLAEYEKELDKVRATEELLRTSLFGPSPAVFAHVVEHEDGDNTTIGGFAMWFLNYSTWEGKHGIYLEDLYIRPEHRGLGYGMALMRELSRICMDRGYARLEWAVLDWNEPAIGFYKELGAIPMDDWTVFRLTTDDLSRLATEPWSE